MLGCVTLRKILNSRRIFFKQSASCHISPICFIATRLS